VLRLARELWLPTCRFGRGGKYRAAKMPKEPLIIWGYEPSPFVRLVKERLTELEIPHLFKTTARGSPKRQEMFDEFGKFQAPFMQDPNTGVAMFESGAICQYLEDTYAKTDIVDAPTAAN
jgi:glutathione S-transferase